MSDEAKNEISTEEQVETKVKWTCEIPTITKEKPWTVGHRHTLSCRGDSTAQLAEPIKIIVKLPAPQKSNAQLPKEGKAVEPQEDPTKDFALKILETKNIDDDSGDFVVTSYKPNKYNNIEIILEGAKGEQIFVEPMSWQVTSVLTQQNKNGFGPTSPLVLEMPWFYWLGIIAAIFVILLLLGSKLFFYLKWKEQTRKIESFSTALSPTNQFYKDVRSLNSDYKGDAENSVSETHAKEYWQKLEEQFKLYLVREFKVPAYQLKNSLIVKKIKKKNSHIWNVRLEGKLNRILAEFEKGNNIKDTIKVGELKQMEKLCQEFIELIKKNSKVGRVK